MPCASDHGARAFGAWRCESLQDSTIEPTDSWRVLSWSQNTKQRGVTGAPSSFAGLLNSMSASSALGWWWNSLDFSIDGEQALDKDASGFRFPRNSHAPPQKTAEEQGLSLFRPENARLPLAEVTPEVKTNPTQVNPKPRGDPEASALES